MGVRCDILCSRSPGETRFAVIEDGRVAEVVIARDGRAEVGSIHRGRVVGRAPGLDAVFVEIGDVLPGFLAAEDARSVHPDPLREGEAVLAQVTGAAHGDKGAKLTLAVSLPGPEFVYGPFRPGVAVSRRVADAEERRRLLALTCSLAMADEGLVARSRAAGADPARLEAAVAALRRRWRQVTERLALPPPVCLDPGRHPLLDTLEREDAETVRLLCGTPDLAASMRLLCREWAPALEARVAPHRGEDLFRLHGVEAAIEEALEPVVLLAGGGRLRIEPTAAVVTIDVDSGGAGRGPLAVNREAAAEIARQIRLRNLSGHMVVDFIGLRSDKDLRRVVAVLRQALAGDAAQVAGPTPFGLVEVVRERRRPPLAEFLCDAGAPRPPDPSVAAVALEALRAVLREAEALRVAGLGLLVSPEVAAALRGPLRPALEEAEGELGQRLDLQVDTKAARHRFEVRTGMGGKERT